MNNPLISIIVPCYNQAQFLPEALQSILEQTYTNWECIIVNDGSPDNTHEVAQEWLAKDMRFQYLKKENGGLSSARNAGLNNASGQWIQFLDSDDILLANKLEKSLHALAPSKEAIVITNFNILKVKENKKRVLPPHCILKQEHLNFNALLTDWDTQFTIPIHCGLFPKKAIQNIRFCETLKAKEDWLFWIQVAQNNNFIFLDQPLVYYRIHTKGMTADNMLMLHNNLQVFKEIKKYVAPEAYEYFLLSKLNYYFTQNNSLHQKIRNKRKINLAKIKQIFTKKNKKAISFKE